VTHLPRQVEDITGQKFHGLVALRHVFGAKRTRWVFLCHCGNEFEARPSHVKNGGYQSCGCLKVSLCAQKAKTHGRAGTTEWTIWVDMIRRCYEKNRPAYKNYGGRGIAVCDRWRQSVENFVADMGARPSSDHSLDRIDNDGDYEPSNCRWATREEQARNKRNSRRVYFDGEPLTAREIADRHGLKAATVLYRMNKGWSGDMLSQPLLRRAHAT
jgi:hypothetical protein